MNTKLTLRMDEDIITRIKNYASNRHLSLSKLTENLFKEKLESDDKRLKELSPIVRKYRGILKGKIKNDKQDLIEYLSTKH